MMKSIKILVHGVPVGHEMFGYDRDDEKSYLKEFYDIKIDSSSAMVTDIIEGNSYYTYIRKYVNESGNDFTNCEGRPGSYFGITICFSKETCDNVYMLYNILDSVYRQKIVGTIIKETKTGSAYLVREIEKVTFGDKSILSWLTIVLEKKIEELIGNSFTSIQSPITTKGKTKFNLAEVDSPIFRDSVRSKQVILSPEFSSSSKLVSDFEQKIGPLETEKNRLKKSNEELSEDLKKLRIDFENFKKAQERSEGSTKKQFEEQIKKLKEDLETTTSERDKLQETINKARKNIDLIDEPSSELMRLLASRFREDDKKSNPKRTENNPKDRSKNSFISWAPVLNCILLFCIIILCVIMLLRMENNNNRIVGNQDQYSVADTLKSKSVETPSDNPSQEQTLSGDDVNVEVEETFTFDDFKACKINVTNYSGTGGLQKNKKYGLNLVRITDSKKANVPDGAWISTEGATVNKNILTVNEDATPGTNILVKYVVDGKTQVSRPLTIE